MVAKRPSELQERLATARQRVAEFDHVDHVTGVHTPTDIGPTAVLTTVREALLTSLAKSDWDCAADAYVMLDDFIIGYGGPKAIGSEA